MTYEVTVFGVLLAGPSDVAEERSAIAAAIDAWNRRNSHHIRVSIQPVMWELDSYSEIGADPQEIINRQLGGKCDGVIAIFSTRLGTATPRFISGTVEEIFTFSDARMKAGIYFNVGKGEIGRLDVEQLARLQDFKTSIRDKGLHRDFQSIPELVGLVEHQFVDWVYALPQLMQPVAPQQSNAKVGFVPTPVAIKIIAAIGQSIVSGGENKIHGLYLSESPEFSGVSQESIFEAVRVLRKKGFLFGAEAGVMFSRWDIGLTPDGLEYWLVNLRNDFDIRHQIAVAIVHSNVRDVEQIAFQTEIASLIVNHVLARWADRDLIVINQFLDRIRVDHFEEPIRQLAGPEPGIPQREVVSRLTPIMEKSDALPRYRTISEPIGLDVVALSDIGGELGDPVAAAIKVDGWTRVQVLALQERRTWTEAQEEAFRNVVRNLAKTHDLLGRSGPVRLVFDPPQNGSETRDETSGEAVQRD